MSNYIKQQGEIFVPVYKHPEYDISNLGRVYSHKSKRFLTPFKTTRGFYQISIDNINLMMHILMVQSFTQCDISKVWFIDGNKNNVVMSNMAWSV